MDEAQRQQCSLLFLDGLPGSDSEYGSSPPLCSGGYLKREGKAKDHEVGAAGGGGQGGRARVLTPPAHPAVPRAP